MTILKTATNKRTKNMGGGRWIAILTAVALTVGMLPAAAFAKSGGNSAVNLDDALTAINNALCSVPSTVANDAQKVRTWLVNEWLDSVPGLSDALGGRTPSEVLGVATVLDNGTVQFSPAVDGTMNAPLGTNGSMPFTVGYNGSRFAEKTCIIEAQRWTPLVVEGGTQGVDYDYTGDAIRFEKEGAYTVSMAEGVLETNHWIVLAADVTITLKDVKIVTDEKAPIETARNVTLVLSGDNSMISRVPWCPGISNEGTLTIKGDGSLTAQGGREAAGIGSVAERDSGVIRIEGGTVNATGGSNAAGIGGGSRANIAVSGGIVNATGGESAPGIGGMTSRGLSVSVSGGVVNAKGGFGAAGIGNSIGSDRYYGNVSISGGTVRAQGGAEGVPGIGIGPDSSADNFSIAITGGSIDATMNPTPRGDADGDGPLAAFDLRRIDYDVPPDTDITHGNLTYPAPVPIYYGLKGIVPDDDDKIYLWLNKNTELKTPGVDTGGNPFEIIFSPSIGATLNPYASLRTQPYTPTSWQVGAVIGTVPEFEGSQLDKVPEVELTTTTLYESAKLNGQTYFIGDVLERGKGDDAQTLVVSSVNPSGPAKGSKPASLAFLNAVDVKTGWTSKVTEGKNGSGLVFDTPVRYPNTPLKEASGYVKVNGATYARTWEAFAVTEEYVEYSWHYLSTLDGKPAGYYHVQKSEGTSAIVSGHFNAGRDPKSIGVSGGDFLVPVEGQVEGLDGAAWLAFLAGSVDASLTGAFAEQGPLGTMTIRQEATALDRLLGDLDPARAASQGNLMFAGGHFAKPGADPELAETVSVDERDGIPVINSVYSLRSTSPFVTVALVKAPTVAAKQVQVAVESEPTSKPKPLAATGDPTASGAATLAVLSLAAVASLVFARRRVR